MFVCPEPKSYTSPTPVTEAGAFREISRLREDATAEILEEAFVDEVPRPERETDDMPAAWCDARGGSEANHTAPMRDPRTDQLHVVFQVLGHETGRKDSIAMVYYGGTSFYQ